MGHLCQVSQIFHSSEEKPSTKWWANLKTCVFGKRSAGIWNICSLHSTGQQRSKPAVWFFKQSNKQCTGTSRKWPNDPNESSTPARTQLNETAAMSDFLCRSGLCCSGWLYLQGTKTWYLHIFLTWGYFFNIAVAINISHPFPDICMFCFF